MGEEQISNFVMIYKDDDDQEIRIPWDGIKSIETIGDTEYDQNEILIPFHEDFTVTFSLSRRSRRRIYNIFVEG